MTQRLVLTLLVMLVSSTVAVSALGRAQPSAGQEEFVPIDQLPPEDQLPAAPLLVAAYAIVWLVVFGYLWSIWRRLSTVERELATLSRRAGVDDERGT